MPIPPEIQSLVARLNQELEEIERSEYYSFSFIYPFFFVFSHFFSLNQ
jgi:hypothetical protein